MKRLLLLLFVVGIAFMTTSCDRLEKVVDAAIKDKSINKEEAISIMSKKPKNMTTEELVDYVMNRCEETGVEMERVDVENALIGTIPDIKKRGVNVSIYLDNTSSMKGYYQSADISRFTSVICAINDYYGSQPNATINAFYTQSEAKSKKTAITKVVFSEMQSKLTHNSMTFGDSYQLDEFFQHLVNQLQNTESEYDGIAFFITDGIPSGTNEEIKNSIGKRYNIANKGVLESRIADQIRPLAGKGYSAAIYQFESNFTGDYYKYNNEKVRLKEKSRPFYVIAIGKNTLMDLFTSEVEKGLQNFKPTHSLVFDVPKEPFTPCSELQVMDDHASNEIKLQLSNDQSEQQVEFQIKRKALPHYLRDEETINNNLLTIEMGKNNCPCRVTNNVITFNVPVDDNMEDQRLHIKVRDIVPTWVESSNSDDDAAMSATHCSQDHLTFNFKCLVQGIKKGIYNSKGAELWLDETFIINTKLD